MKIEVISTALHHQRTVGFQSSELPRRDGPASVHPQLSQQGEVKSWPIVGWFVDFAGTLYIRRKAKENWCAFRLPSLRYGTGKSLTLFPEGTTTNGEECLPFHPSLLQPACQQGQSVTPVHLRYECRGGDVSEDVHSGGT